MLVHHVGVEDHPIGQHAIGRELVEQGKDALAVCVALDRVDRCELVGERDVAGDAQVAVPRKAFLHVSEGHGLPEVIAPAAKRASWEPTVDAFYRDVVEEDVASVAVKRQEQQIQVGKLRHSRQRVGNHETPLYSACFSLCGHQRELGAHRGPMLSNRDCAKRQAEMEWGHQPRSATAGYGASANCPISVCGPISAMGIHR